MDEEERRVPRSRKKKPMSAAAKIGMGMAVVAVLGGIAGTAGYLYYTGQGAQYRTVFFPNTVVNGFDVSMKTVDEAEEIVASKSGDYVLTIVGRGGVEEKITGEEVGMYYVFDDSLNQYLASQDPMDWWGHRNVTTEYQIDTMRVADEDMLSERIEKLVFLDDTQIVEPKDAYLSDYIEGEGYKIIPEEEGTALDKLKVKKAVRDAVHNLDTVLNLEDLDVYLDADVMSDDKTLNETADKLNGYLAVTVTYQFGDETEVLDKDTLAGWITLGEDGTIVLDEEQVAAFVKGLADKYDTAGKPKMLKTTSGETVTVPGATYGWRIDQEKEAEELCALISAGESQIREPVYAQKARSHGVNDYGDTYVEVNLTAQHLYFYKDGKLVIDSDFVSGSHSKKHDTPTGAYFINYKQRNRVLRGERRADGSYEYESPVSYWMPFNGGIGLHDASWRGAFGGKIYLTNGSHGCVNLPTSVAKTIYASISTGDAVLCFTTDDSGSNVYPGSSKPAASKTDASDQPKETQPAVTQPAETQPAATQPAETQPQPGADLNVPNPETESQAAAGPPEASNSGPSAPIGPVGGQVSPAATQPAETQPETQIQPESETQPSGPVAPGKRTGSWGPLAE